MDEDVTQTPGPMLVSKTRDPFTRDRVHQCGIETKEVNEV